MTRRDRLAIIGTALLLIGGFVAANLLMGRPSATAVCEGLSIQVHEHGWPADSGLAECNAARRREGLAPLDTLPRWGR